MFGPAELFSLVPGRLAIEFTGPGAGPVASSQGGQVTAATGYDAAATPDIMLIPGGQGTRRLVTDEAFLSWLRARATPAYLVTSVCTGSAVLAAAGLPDGHRATSNKAAFAWVREPSGKAGWIAQEWTLTLTAAQVHATLAAAAATAVGTAGPDGHAWADVAATRLSARKQEPSTESPPGHDPSLRRPPPLFPPEDRPRH